jgi:hypothetical protein
MGGGAAVPSELQRLGDRPESGTCLAYVLGCSSFFLTAIIKNGMYGLV